MGEGLKDPGPSYSSSENKTNKDTVNNVNAFSTCVTFNSFPCIYSNVQSIGNKLGEFSSFVETFKPYIIGLTETWLSSDMVSAEFNLNGYELFRCDRSDGKGGGGTVLYLLDKMQSECL